MQSIGKLIAKKFDPSDTDKYVSQEFQKYAYELAKELDDLPHKSLYMKLAKRHSADTLLKIAKDVADREGVENKGAYFMKIISEMGILKNGKDPKAGK